MPFTEKEQLQFEEMVKNNCSADCSKDKWIKKVADFLFNLTGDVNWRMSIGNKYNAR